MFKLWCVVAFLICLLQPSLGMFEGIKSLLGLWENEPVTDDNPIDFEDVDVENKEWDDYFELNEQHIYGLPANDEL